MRWIQLGSTLFGFNDDLTLVTIKTREGEVSTRDLGAFVEAYSAAKAQASSDVDLTGRLNHWAVHNRVTEPYVLERTSPLPAR